MRTIPSRSLVAALLVTALSAMTACGATPASDGVDASLDARPSANDAASDASAPACQGDGGVGHPLLLAIPMYTAPPSTMWDVVVRDAPPGSLLIANAGTPGGPGTVRDAAYTAAIVSAHGAGKIVIGYVDSNYVKQPLASAKTDVDAWYSFYPDVDGIFVDQVTGVAGDLTTYYQPLAAHVRGKTGRHLVVINPGQTAFDEGYMASSDVVMSYESPLPGYARGVYSAPAWLGSYEPTRFWHVVIEAKTTADMRDVIRLACERNAGFVFVTEYPDPPAYSQLPSYFAEELAALRGN